MGNDLAHDCHIAVKGSGSSQHGASQDWGEFMVRLNGQLNIITERAKEVDWQGRLQCPQPSNITQWRIPFRLRGLKKVPTAYPMLRSKYYDECPPDILKPNPET